jgi:hypothetical protein
MEVVVTPAVASVVVTPAADVPVAAVIQVAAEDKSI